MNRPIRLAILIAGLVFVAVSFGLDWLDSKTFILSGSEGDRSWAIEGDGSILFTFLGGMGAAGIVACILSLMMFAAEGVRRFLRETGKPTHG